MDCTQAVLRQADAVPLLVVLSMLLLLIWVGVLCAVLRRRTASGRAQDDAEQQETLDAMRRNEGQ